MTPILDRPLDLLARGDMVMTPDPKDVGGLGLLYRYHADGALRWLDATGVTMEPTAPPGSKLLVDFARRDARVGEIVVFERRGSIVAHRIVATRGRGAGLALIPKGDAESYPDPAIRPDDILGVVRQVQRPDGHAVPAALGRAAGRPRGARLLVEQPRRPRRDPDGDPCAVTGAPRHGRQRANVVPDPGPDDHGIEAAALTRGLHDAGIVRVRGRMA